jgi:hypothetical protein
MPSLDIGNWGRWIMTYLCISSTKGVALLLSNAYTERDVWKLQCFHVSRLENMPKGTAELSSIEWSHWSRIALSTTSNRVIDHRDHMMGHKTIRLHKLHQRPREFSFQSSWIPILPVKVFIVFVRSFLVAPPLLSKSRMRFLLRGRVVTLCVTKTPNHYLNLWLNPKVRTNQVTKVWNQIQRKDWKIPTAKIMVLVA